MVKGIDPSQAAYSYSPAKNPERANDSAAPLSSLDEILRGRMSQNLWMVAKPVALILAPPLISSTTRSAYNPHVAPLEIGFSTVPAFMTPNLNDPPHNARTKTPLQPPKPPFSPSKARIPPSFSHSFIRYEHNPTPNDEAIRLNQEDLFTTSPEKTSGLVC
ncbi:hypothetical protein PtA15_11A608 [Puccinia triticina]|uniref:Uncharacterized protein n=1 Tax=Puccinia triticina TaxID=208348 RepID=A0ABY7CX99_9BASI|nr:uncharacterized protein PtA15_11A608 [Puccinia triticina]WAQ89916.1 hypothetical protein PtA15_11A608 [Puccinia triticina]